MAQMFSDTQGLLWFIFPMDQWCLATNELQCFGVGVECGVWSVECAVPRTHNLMGLPLGWALLALTVTVNSSFQLGSKKF